MPALGPDQHRAHAGGVRHLEIAHEVFEHGGPRRIHAVALEELLEGDGLRLRNVGGRLDVEDRIEMLEDAQGLRRLLGMALGAIRQDQATARQLRQRGVKAHIRRKGAASMSWTKINEMVGIGVAMIDQSAQRRAMALVEVLLQGAAARPSSHRAPSDRR